MLYHMLISGFFFFFYNRVFLYILRIGLEVSRLIQKTLKKFTKIINFLNF